MFLSQRSSTVCNWYQSAETETDAKFRILQYLLREICSGILNIVGNNVVTWDNHQPETKTSNTKTLVRNNNLVSKGQLEPMEVEYVYIGQALLKVKANKEGTLVKMK